MAASRRLELRRLQKDVIPQDERSITVSMAVKYLESLAERWHSRTTSHMVGEINISFGGTDYPFILLHTPARGSMIRQSPLSSVRINAVKLKIG